MGPVYNCFFSSIRNNGCETVSSPLIYNKALLRYEIDFHDLEQRLSHERARLLRENRVWVNAGSMYGKEGEGFIRINMACPWSRLEEGIKRIGK